MPAEPYVCKVIEHASPHFSPSKNGRTLVFSDGSEAEVVWHGGMGELMPPYNSRSQWSMFVEHMLFADPGSRLPKTNEDIFLELKETDRPELPEEDPEYGA